MKFGATDCFSIFGMRNSGKTYLGNKIAELYPRKIIIDPMAEYSGDFITSDFNNFTKILKSEILEKKLEKYTVVFRFSPHVRATDKLFDAVMQVIFELGNCQVIIDEVQLFSNPHFLPHYLKNILMIGRHRGISLMAITQRPSQMHKGILAQSAHIFCGQLHEKNDIGHISDFINLEKSQLIRLGKRKFIYFSPFMEGIKIFSTEKNNNSEINSKKINKKKKNSKN